MERTARMFVALQLHSNERLWRIQIYTFTKVIVRIIKPSIYRSDLTEKPHEMSSEPH